MVKVYKVHPASPDRRVLEEAVAILRRGGVIAFPTDTVYGLGCDPFDPKSVERIYSIKGRERKPLPLLIDSTERVDEMGVMNRRARTLADTFWPGPLTIKIFPVKPMPQYLVDEEGKIAIRVPDHPVPIELAKGLGGVIIGTSANRSGSTSPVTAEEVLSELHGIDLLIDAGPSRYRAPSTVIDVTRPRPVVLRVGAVSPEDLESVLGEELVISTQ